MAYETFIQKSFRGESLKTIAQADKIIREYRMRGFTLTLRQLYYQFVARGLRENTERSYKNLGKLMTDARLAGEIDWGGIEDRGRSISGWLAQEDEEAVFEGIEYGFSLDFWKRQEIYIEAWIEKDALSSVLERPARRWHLPYMACKGYLSASEAYNAGKRFEAALADGHRCIVLHLGDHDPSGIDMTRDNDERLHQLANASWAGEIEVKRLALNMDQVEHYNPPTNPAKLTDSRATDYVEKYGRKSWELDALDPQVIYDLVDTSVRDVVDLDLWRETSQEQDDRRSTLAKVHENWGDIKAFIEREF